MKGSLVSVGEGVFASCEALEAYLNPAELAEALLDLVEGLDSGVVPLIEFCLFRTFFNRLAPESFVAEGMDAVLKVQSKPEGLEVALPYWLRISALFLRFAAGLDEGPDRALSPAAISSSLVFVRSVTSAGSAVQKAIALDPKNDFLYYFFGIISIAQGVFDDVPFRKAIELNPGFADAHLVLGHVLMHKDKQDEAVKHYQAAARLGHKGAEKMLAEWGVGK